MNAYGNAYTHLAQAIAAQAATLEQVIFAGFTHPQAERLAGRLVRHLPQGLEKIFFSDDGSTAVEVALKMAWQHWQHLGESRKCIAALRGAYHGDTFGAMSVSGRGVFTRAFEPLLFEVASLPGPDEAAFDEIEKHLAAAHAQSPLAALILEPLVQGAAGMRMYAPERLRSIAEWCRMHHVLLIADEVMTGFWRTGTFWACEQAGVQPDLLCMSKALTGGFLPMGITACTQAIYDSFLSNDRSRALFHGHSYTANPLACAAANASLDLFEEESFATRHTALCQVQEQWAQRMAQHSRLRNVRRCGTILAMDLASEGEAGYLSDAAKGIAQTMLEQGFLIRPLGEVIYTLPPYCVSGEEMDALYLALCAALNR